MFGIGILVHLIYFKIDENALKYAYKSLMLKSLNQLACFLNFVSSRIAIKTK